MNIAITYDLRIDYLAKGYTREETAEFDSPETITAIETALQNLGCETESIGDVKHLAQALVSGKRWDLVFNIAEGCHGLGREAQVPALLDAYNIPYTFSDVTTIACTLNKVFAKQIVRDKGVPTADFFLVRELSDLSAFTLAFPVFAKPVAEGTGKGICAASKILSHEALKKRCKYLLKTYHQPVLVETYLPGREFTVGIFGNGSKAEVGAIMEIILQEGAEKNAYSFTNKESYEGKIEYQIAYDAEAKRAGENALKAYQALHCRDSARIDIRSDVNGHPHFMEANPIAGLHPTSSDLVLMMRLLGHDYDFCIKKILTAACLRLHLPLPYIQKPISICA